MSGDRQNQKIGGKGDEGRILLSRANWEQMARSASLPLVAMDREGRIFFAASSFHAMFHSDSDSLPGTRLTDKLDAAGGEALILHLDRVINRKQSCTCELRFEIPSQGVLWLRLTSQPDEGGEAGSRCWSWVENITAARQSEQHVSSFRRMARAALKSGRIVEAGQKMMDILRAHEHIDGGCVALVNEKSGEVYYPVFADDDAPCPQPHAPHGGLAGHLLASGQVIWWNDLSGAGKSGGPLFEFAREPAPSDLIGIPLKTGRSVVGFMIVYRLRPGCVFNQRDIELMIGTGSLLEGVAGRMRVKEIDAVIVSSMHQNPDPVVVTDRNGVIEYVNPAFEQITGYAGGEVLGSPVSILNSGRQDPVIYRELWQSLTAGQPWRGHFVNRDKNGRLFEEDAVIWPLRERNGDIARFVAIKHVLTGKESSAPVETHDVDRSLFNRVVSVFTHDFRNTLLSIRMNADLLRSGSPSENRDEVTQISEASSQAEALIEHISALTAPVGHMLRDVDINQQIHRVQPLAEKLLGTKRRLRIELDARLELVRIPAGLIEKILLTLFFYAQRVTPHGQSLSIRTFKDQIHESDRPHLINPPSSDRYTYAALEFSGSGLAAGFVRGRAPERVSDPDLEWASGLPDLLVRLLDHHGCLMVRQAAGEQGVVRIYFETVDPLVSHAAAGPAETAAGEGRASETVLIAEDDPGARRVMRRILQNRGYRVLEAENGATAVRTLMFHEGKIDLLLADVMMPDFDGKTLADQIQNLHPGIKVLFVSGFDVEELARQNISLGGASAMLVKKPFSGDELLGMVRRCLTRV